MCTPIVPSPVAGAMHHRRSESGQLVSYFLPATDQVDGYEGDEGDIGEYPGLFDDGANEQDGSFSTFWGGDGYGGYEDALSEGNIADGDTSGGDLLGEEVYGSNNAEELDNDQDPISDDNGTEESDTDEGPTSDDNGTEESGEDLTSDLQDDPDYLDNEDLDDNDGVYDDYHDEISDCDSVGYRYGVYDGYHDETSDCDWDSFGYIYGVHDDYDNYDADYYDADYYEAEDYALPTGPIRSRTPALLPAASQPAAVVDPVDPLCTICFDNTADTLLLPCRHLNFCKDCCDKLGLRERGPGLRTTGCPICRQIVFDRITVFRG